MAESTNLRPITDVPAVEEFPDGATVLINDNGSAKQIPADKIVAEPMKVIIDGATLETLTCDKTFDEIKAASDAGKTIIFILSQNGQEGARSNLYNIMFSTSLDDIQVIFMAVAVINILSDGTINVEPVQ